MDAEWATCLSCGSSGRKPVSLPPLPSDSSLRLLWLLPGSGDPDDPVRCNMHVEDLRHEPIFSAVSYTWADEDGGDRRLASISIDGRPLRVTRNCDAALRRVRQGGGASQFVWIDAVCIDQGNDVERGHQVKLMPQIYHQARHVYMYVGEHTYESRRLFIDLAVSSRAANDDDEGGRNRLRQQGRAVWEALKARRYFTRLWILQEIALARHAVVLCGGNRMPWADVTASFPHRFKFDADRQDAVLWFDRSLCLGAPGAGLVLLDGGRRADARDPRDKVYGLLGLLPGRRIGSVVADYTVSAQQLYAAVAVQLAEIHGWRAVLVRAGTRHQALAGLPSWAPDWSFRGDGYWERVNTPMGLYETQRVVVSRDRIRLKLIRYHGDTGLLTRWAIPNAQDGDMADIHLIVDTGNHGPLARLYNVPDQMYNLRLELGPHKSPENPARALFEATAESGVLHLPIERGIFFPLMIEKIRAITMHAFDPLGVQVSATYEDYPKTIVDVLRSEYEKPRDEVPVEAWARHAEDLWARKYPIESMSKMRLSVDIFEANDLFWTLLVRRFAVRAEMVDIA
ncbi:hypothetical protein LQW54_006511 [Pestalotiopsis sp. IQ-011]